MKKFIEYLIIILATVVIYEFINYFHENKEQPQPKTQTSDFKAQNDTIYTNLTINTSTRKEGSRSHPITYSGLSIYTAHKRNAVQFQKTF